MKQITYGQAVATADALAARYGVDRSEGYGPWIYPGSHENSASDWIISWEECPDYEWTFREDIPAPDGFYAEAINHFAVAFFPG